MARTKLTPIQNNNGTSTQANAGNAGGNIWWINLGGIKFLWGTTGTITISGTGAQTSGAFAITLPAFFTTIQSVNVSPGTTAAGTNALSADVQSLSTSSLSVCLSQSAGTNGSCGISFFVVGT